MFDYETALELLAHRTVLCIGDLMLDDFVYGEVSRVSPEAPVPVIAVRREEKVIGGAGNVARNLAGLGACCLFVGVIGADEAAELVTKAIAGFGGAARKCGDEHVRLEACRVRGVGRVPEQHGAANHNILDLEALHVADRKRQQAEFLRVRHARAHGQRRER